MAESHKDGQKVSSVAGNFSRLTLGEILDMLAAQLPKGLRATQVATSSQFKAFAAQEILMPKSSLGLLVDAVRSSFAPGEEPVALDVEAAGDDPQNLNALLALIPKQMNQDQVKGLLRDAKDDPLRPGEVKITGENYQDVVQTNLRRAVVTGAIPRQEVVELVQEAEESDKQHIFFYKVKAGDNRLDDMKDVGSRLFGKDWPIKTGFPHFVASTPTFLWSDFREIKNTGGKADGWLLKAYDTGVKHSTQNLSFDTGKKIIIEEPTFHRLVFVARWRPSLRLFEIHIPFGYGKEGTMAHLKTFRAALALAVPIDELQEWDLEPCRKRIRDLRKEPKIDYKVSQSTSLDSSRNRTRITSASVSESLTDSKEANEKLDSASKANEEQPEVTVAWVVTVNEKGKDREQDVRTPMGTFGTNEIAFSARVTSEIIEHVTNRLAKIASSTS